MSIRVLQTALRRQDMHAVGQWLRRERFDGLFAAGECACQVGDLAPCGNDDITDCRPGYKTPCDCGDHRWHISEARVTIREDG